MGKKHKQQDFAKSFGTNGGAGNFMRSPQGKGLIAAGAVALAGLLFSKGERATNIRNQIKGAAGRLSGGQGANRTASPMGSQSSTGAGMTATPSMGGSGYASGTGYAAGGDGTIAH